MSAAGALPDAADRERALDLSAHALVMAPAGSGKTGLLVHRLLRALAVVDKPEQVVAITFTNKAAAEIRARVLEVLRAARAKAEPRDAHERALHACAQVVLERDERLDWQLLAQPARLNAQTIDAFCAQVGAQLPLLSGLGGGMAIAEDPRGLYLDAISRLFEEIEDASVPAEDREALARVLRLSGNRLDRLVEPLSAMLARREQWIGAAAATDEDWTAQDAVALASLIEPALRDFENSLDPVDRGKLVGLLREGAGQHELLAWAAELRDWPQADGPQAGLLRRIAACLLTADGQLRRKVDVRAGFVARQPYTQAFMDLLASQRDNALLQAAATAVCRLPDRALPAELCAMRTAWLRVLRRLAAHLRVAFAESQQADFPQLAQSALQALRPGGGVGDALLAADRSIRHLLVDEMQDTSETQLRLLESLTAAWTPGDGRSLFLVGDPQQSIYAFRKAEVRLFLRLWDERRLGSLPLTPLRLSANFRSEPAVVGWFNEAFARIFPRTTDTLRGAVPFAASVALREADGAGGIDVVVHDDAEAEARAVAQEAARRLAPGRTVAVLARARSHLQPVIRALREQGLTPACQDIDPLAALPEVRDVFALARALWHPEDRLSWAVLLRAPFVGLSWAQLVHVSQGRADLPWPSRIAAALDDPGLDDDARRRLRRLQGAIESTAAQRALRAELADRVEAVWTRLGGPMGCTRPALDDVRQALRCLREETRGGGIRDPERLERRLAELYAAPREGQVQLMTVHKAKGLEFDHVLLTGLNRSVPAEARPPLHLMDLSGATLLVPHPDEAWPPEHSARDASTRAFDCLHALHTEARRNEGYRLLYVAVTRARRTATLHLSAERDPQSGAARLKAHSFAAMLEPVIRPRIDSVVVPAEAAPGPAAPAPVEPMPPRAPRLRPDVEVPPEPSLYQPAEVRTLRPSEAVLAAQEEPGEKRDEGDLYAQLVGTLYHEAMQRIAGEGLDAWADAGASRRGSMAAGLRRRGMPEPRVEPAVARVIDLLGRTLGSERGRWLVSPKPWARSEYPLAGLRDGRWVSAVIDRCFEDEEGRLWVIDYKTRAEAVPPSEHDAYVAEGTARYRAQVLEYVTLMRALRPGREIRGALYFVEADRLVEPA